MNKLVLSLGLLLALTPKTNAAPLEAGAIYTSEWTQAHAQDIGDELTTLVRQNGYKCDSISAIISWTFSFSFTLQCNRYRYEYEIQDKGGRWVVDVQ